MKLGFVLGFGLAFGFVAACGSDNGGNNGSTPVPGTSTDGGDAGPPVCTADIAAPETRAVACAVTLSSPGLQQPASQHLPVGTQINYCTNPPSSGPHYAIWADFKEYDKEIPWPYLVHSEEHGGVLLLYKCETPCPDVVEALRAVRDRAAADATCDSEGRKGLKRIIIAPSTTIPTRVAASAWAATYTAECADGPTLDEFVAKKGKNGPEDLCFDGQATF